MSATIFEIAKKAGVSISTVSLVFNSKQGVGSETRQRVIRIAKELNYKKAAPSLRSGSSGKALRFLKISRHGRTVNRDHDAFIADYIQGIGEQARRNGHSVEVNMFDLVPMDEVIDFLKKGEISGAVILGTELAREEAGRFCGLKIPVVILDTYYEYLPIDFVDMNNTDAVFRAISHFVEMGHREIGFVKGNADVENFRLRETGFIKAMGHFSLPVSKKNILSVDATFQGAYDDMLRFLHKGGRPPPALFISNDIMAYGCMKAMREKGLSIPKDVSVIGFDDLPMSSLMEIPLTTVSVSKAVMGKRAVELLSAKIAEGNRRPPEKVLIDGNLMIRQSVAKRK